MKYSRPRGTQDIIPPDVYTWRRVEAAFAAALERYAYEPVRTPMFESTDLFLRSVGEGTDVSKEMYTFEDRGGRSLTLRPENTAAIIRAYLEAGMHRLPGVQRLGYIGPMFRYDRPQKGRYRQFHQVGAEAIGSMNPMLDAEIIDVVMSGLDILGFKDLSVEINTVGCGSCRPAFVEKLRAALEGLADELCDDCRERAVRNPLRIFDCKKCAGLKDQLPTITDNVCEECREHYASVKGYLDALRLSYNENPQLVRGLDYYTKTVFEILHGELGAQNALCGGGRYDDLVEECGGPSTPAVGFSAGLERIIGVLPDDALKGVVVGKAVDVYVAVVDDGAATRALVLADHVRAFGNVEVDATFRALKKQLAQAEKTGARAVVIVDSASPDSIKWKDMASRDQREIADADVAEFAAQRLQGEA